MKITVRLFATLREGRSKGQDLDVAPASTPRDLMGLLKIEERDVSILLVNGRDGKIYAPLSEGDCVSLFPPVGGG